MTFENITNGTDCDCLQGAIEDPVSIYARVLNKDTVLEKDFLSKWEKGNVNSTNCEEVCGLKGVSVSKVVDDEVKSRLLSVYRQRFKLSPKYKRGVLLFKFKQDAGLLQHTPDDDPNHHDFYKSDLFSLDSIDHSTIEPLGPAQNV